MQRVIKIFKDLNLLADKKSDTKNGIKYYIAFVNNYYYELHKGVLVNGQYTNDEHLITDSPKNIKKFLSTLPKGNNSYTVG
jgi:hypothetical protein